VRVVIVPGLRGESAEHWQTHLAAMLPEAVTIPPLGRAELSLHRRTAQLECAVEQAQGPAILVAHSGGALTVVHWAAVTRQQVHGALLAVPPDFDHPLPEGYPAMVQLQAAGWLPVPRRRLPFRSIVTASQNDPLARFERVAELAAAWGSELVNLGDVGHLNPDSGYGPWPDALSFIERLRRTAPAERV
jgi:predicted alpha/beta hydrolase family esterase